MSVSALQLIAMRGPQFSADPRLNSLIAYCGEKLSATYFGDAWGEAVGLKVLHILTLEAMSGGNPGTGTTAGTVAGGVASKSEGDLSVSDQKPGGSVAIRNPDLTGTQFGLELLALMRECHMGPATRMILCP